MIRRESSLNRTNWISDIAAGKLTLPFVVVMIIRTQEDFFGDVEAWRFRTDVFKVIDRNTAWLNPSDHTKGVNEEIYADGQASLLKDAYRAYNGVAFAPANDQATADNSWTNPVNRILMEGEDPYYAAMVTLNPLVADCGALMA